MADERIRLLLDLGHSAADAEKVVIALDKLDAAAKKAGGGVAGMGHSMLQTGRVVQDFAQGGVGGVLNNIEGLTMALGLGSGLAGILTVVGVAAFVAGPKIKAFFGELIGGANEVPKSTDHLKAWDEELKSANKTLDDLREKHILTNTELKQFNELTARATELQSKLNDAKKAEAEIEKLRQHKTDEQKETAAAVSEFIGADVDAFVAEASDTAVRAARGGGRLGQLEAQSRQQAARGKGPGGGVAAIMAGILRDQAAKEEQRLRDAVKADVAGAAQGQPGALGRLIDRLPLGDPRRRGLEQLTPEARRMQDAELEADAENDAKRAEHNKRVRARRKANQEVADLEAEFALGNAEIDRAGDAAQARKIQQAQKLGRQVGQQAGKDDAAMPKIPMGHLSLLPMDASAAQLNHAMLENQAQMTQNMAALEALLRQAQAVGRANRQVRVRLENNPMPPGNGR